MDLLKATTIHGTMHTLLKPPPTFDGGDWLTVGYDLLVIHGYVNEEH